MQFTIKMGLPHSGAVYLFATAFSIQCILIFAFWDECPVTTVNCFCKIKYTRHIVIQCNQLGNISTLPQFNSFDYILDEFQVLQGSSYIEKLHNSTFHNILVLSIAIQGVQLKSVESGVFRHLNSTVKKIHLGDNHLRDIPATTFHNLVKLEYIGLQNNYLKLIRKDWFVSVPFLKHLDLYGNDIYDVTGGIFDRLSNLQILDIHYNNIKHLHTGIFAENTVISDIILSYNHIKSLTGNIFSKNNTLYKLDVSNNEISNISSEFISALTHLELIYISDNKLSQISYNILLYLSHLTYVDVSNNELGEIEDISNKPSFECEWYYFIAYLNKLTLLPISLFQNCFNLQRIDISHNSIEFVDKFPFMIKLWDLNMKQNQISGIQDEAFNGLGNLLYLDLSHNNIRTLNESSLTGLSKLISLDLTYNHLTSLADVWFSDMLTLEVLYLAHNNINHLKTNCIRSLINLNLISLDHNNLSRIDNLAFYSNTALNSISLSHNILTSFQKQALRGLTKLHYLYLDHNNISNYLFGGNFSELHNVYYFDLSHNYIYGIYHSAFDRMDLLEHLDLSYNKIMLLSTLSFMKQRKLKTLNLAHNNINYVTASHFIKLKELRRLDLSHNTLIITYLDQHTYNEIPNLQMLNLDNNYIWCEYCELRWMIEDERIKNSERYICGGPQFLENYNLKCVMENMCNKESFYQNLFVVGSSWPCKSETTTTSNVPSTVIETSTEPFVTQSFPEKWSATTSGIGIISNTLYNDMPSTPNVLADVTTTISSTKDTKSNTQDLTSSLVTSVIFNKDTANTVDSSTTTLSFTTPELSVEPQNVNSYTQDMADITSGGRVTFSGYTASGNGITFSGDDIYPEFTSEAETTFSGDEVYQEYITTEHSVTFSGEESDKGYMTSSHMSLDYTTGYRSGTVFTSGSGDEPTYSIEDFSDENLMSGSMSSASGDLVSIDHSSGYGSGTVFSSSAEYTYSHEGVVADNLGSGSVLQIVDGSAKPVQYNVTKYSVLHNENLSKSEDNSKP